MFKEDRKKLNILVFLLASVSIILFLFSKTQTITKKAESETLKATFSSEPGGRINKIWTNFAQGGEEKKLMLAPAQKEIVELKPQFIRIDHIFDFGNIIQKNAQGEIVFDFSDLDQRIQEIADLGALPFLSLSYFPAGISSSPITRPASYDLWEKLIEATVQRYSGRDEKGLEGIYYEVWNEPDLFGKMDAKTYFDLYKTSVEASQKCQNCHPFKIGGPAITTLKPDWMETFLSLVNQNQIRLDFISWHSYQLNPQKTYQEIGALKNLASYQSLYSLPEIIISEWGSLPEMSPLHDSYFDASHTIAAISLLKNSLDKIFAFELKDGPSPENKKYWGRWGMLTHQAYGITPKPRYYSFLYLNKLLPQELKIINNSPDISLIGSTDGKEKYSIVASRGGSSLALINLEIKEALPGKYSLSVYSNEKNQNPLEPQKSEVVFNGGSLFLNLPASPHSVKLIELTRLSPSLAKGQGRNGINDYSAKITSFVAPLVFPLYLFPDSEKGEIGFWFKQNWGEGNMTYPLLESKSETGDGLYSWIENTQEEAKIYFQIFSKNQAYEEISFPFPKDNLWHQLSFKFDNRLLVFSLAVDENEHKNSINPSRPVRLGKILTIGSNSARKNYAEGFIDDLFIFINNQSIYSLNFNN